jgi:hypothetical protein
MHDHYDPDEEKIIKEMNEGLNYLDSSVEMKKPDVMQLFDLVNTVEEKKATRQNKQFITFLIIAVAAICLETFLFNRSFTFFIVIQLLTLICAIPLVIVLIKKRNRQVTL